MILEVIDFWALYTGLSRYVAKNGKTHMTVANISYSKAIDALKDGGAILGALALPVNGLNGVSVVCCKRDCSSLQAIRTIYQGCMNQGSPSVVHFTNGLRPYMEKESARLLCKVGGLTFLKPQLEESFRHDPYGALKTSVCFSGSLAAWEMAIQPFDTWCTQAQTGKVWTHVRDAYVGSAANGVRQFKTWMIFSYAESFCNRKFVEKTDIDPHSPYGIAAKSIPVGFSVTVLCHPEQRLKNHLQCFKEVVEESFTNNRSRYLAAWNHIIEKQGYGGLFRGLLAKSLSNSILAGGAMVLLEKGRRAGVKKDPS